MSTVLEVQDLRLQRGVRRILDGVSFGVGQGEIVALVGLSGSGKTTVLRVVADLEPEGRASVRIVGSDDHISRRQRGSRVGMVFQFHHLFEHLTIMDNVCLAPVRVHGVSRAEAERRAHEWLDQLGIGHRTRALPRELSGGEAQRAAIARALAMDPPLLLLDEPTASLDPPRRSALGTLLGDLAKSGRAILVTSHDLDFVRDCAHRVLVLSNGAIVEAGAPSHVFTSPSHEATRTMLQRQRTPGNDTNQP